ncbi:hypothetical protein [Clostridioides sp. ZZV14-6345]|uniref:hypothetical protein n=1 Tax=Clostridioides sp. ZZV14-6345 TaxID=2811496 RepID=UPI001D11E154|nr:hypothetical protein [Clostridioides sp. ZZV14-6345]
MGLRIELNNLESWTKEYTKAFKPCFTVTYSKKYLERFANDRFQNIVDEQELDLTDKEFKNYKKIFVKIFIDTMIELIEEEAKNLKNKKKIQEESKKKKSN